MEGRALDGEMQCKGISVELDLEDKDVFEKHYWQCQTRVAKYEI